MFRKIYNQIWSIKNRIKFELKVIKYGIKYLIFKHFYYDKYYKDNDDMM